VNKKPVTSERTPNNPTIHNPDSGKNNSRRVAMRNLHPIGAVDHTTKMQGGTAATAPGGSGWKERTVRGMVLVSIHKKLQMMPRPASQSRLAYENGEPSYGVNQHGFQGP
jgi:hypothetical protein